MTDKKKYILKEYFALCPNGACQDLLTEEEKNMAKDNGTMFLAGVIQRAAAENR